MLQQQLDRRVAGADFDQNLSPRLVARLADLYPDSNHIYLLGLDRVPDQDGRQYARREGFLQVPKDVYFKDLYMLQNFPSKEGFGQPSSSSDQADLRRRHTSARDTINPEVHNAANSRSYY